MAPRELTAAEKERARPKLPAPWVHIGTLDRKQFDALEQAAGANMQIEDLTPAEQQGVERSMRSIQVLGRRWVSIQNTTNEAIVYLRLQTAEAPELPLVRVSAVVVPFQPAKDLTGADLRSIPVQALTAAYSAHEAEGDANLRRTFQLMDAIKEDPLAPLPQATASDSFSARAARQYVAFEEQKLNPVDEMAKKNGVAKVSVQRWLTRARKRGFLPPAVQGKRND